MSDFSATTPASTSAQNGQTSPADPSEVGWQFVPQYYTFINKQPDRLHCFYKKSSTFIHGTEGEDGHSCHGQHEIHEKIMSMNLEDCKVFIHSVDAQSSAAGGIIIQVIGEMSNRGEAWRKFAQTFFLAEQPKGYYILNDIFRYLKEESVEDEEIVEGEDAETATSVQGQEQVVPVVEEEFQPEPVATEEVEVAEEPVREPTPIPAADPVLEEPPTLQSQPNGVHEEPEKEAELEAPTDPEPAQEPEAAAASVEASPVPAPVAAQAAQPPAPAAAEKPVQPTPAPQQQAPSKPAEPEIPAGGRTWAHLAAANSKKWSTALATESRGTSIEAAPTPPPPSRTPVQQAPSQSVSQSQGQRNVREIAASLTRPEVFVKGVVDPMTNAELETLLGKYGKIVGREYVRNRAIAFFEFDTIEAARAAIIDSGNHNAGGNGGIYFQPASGDRMRIVVDVKREKGDKDRPPARPRQGGIPNQPNAERGNGFRGGRGGVRGRGITAGGK